MLDTLLMSRMLGEQSLFRTEYAPLYRELHSEDESAPMEAFRRLAEPHFREFNISLHSECAPPPDSLGPEILSLGHEQGVLALETPCGESSRKRSGSFYTPMPLARHLCLQAMEQFPPERPWSLVCDPAAGGGVFLVTMLHLLMDRETTREKACLDVLDQLHGVDLDPRAVRLCRARLLLNALALGLPPGALPEAARALRQNIRLGDSLLEEQGYPRLQLGLRISPARGARL